MKSDIPYIFNWLTKYKNKAQNIITFSTQKRNICGYKPIPKQACYLLCDTNKQKGRMAFRMFCQSSKSFKASYIFCGPSSRWSKTKSWGIGDKLSTEPRLNLFRSFNALRIWFVSKLWTCKSVLYASKRVSDSMGEHTDVAIETRPHNLWLVILNYHFEGPHLTGTDLEIYWKWP